MLGLCIGASSQRLMALGLPAAVGNRGGWWHRYCRWRLDAASAMQDELRNRLKTGGW